MLKIALAELFDELATPIAMITAFAVLLTLYTVGSLISARNDMAEAHFKSEMAKNNITCPRCAYVPEGLQRLEDAVLIEGSALPLPTQTYLAHLEKTCASSHEPYAKSDCARLLGEVRIGVDDVRSRINPIYGRLPFAPEQLNRVKWLASHVVEILEILEYRYTANQYNRYLDKKFSRT